MKRICLSPPAWSHGCMLERHFDAEYGPFAQFTPNSDLSIHVADVTCNHSKPNSQLLTVL